MRSRLLFTVGIVLFGLSLHGQNKYIPPDPYSITENKLHFSKYLIVSPAFMGPNSLPVPRLFEGATTKKFRFGMEYEYYYASGEQTHDVFANIQVPVANGKVSLEFSYVPYEFYSMDSITSRERRTSSGEAVSGTAFGDVYFGTHVQLIRDHRWIPDMAFGMSCRTASGTGIENARHTDTPGYYLDFSFGKTHYFGASATGIRWHGLLGFYVWQTYLDQYPQNDALMYGAGLQFISRDVYINQSVRGLSGYMFNGDHPLVYRAELGIQQGAAALILGFEKGLVDYPFNSIKMGIRINGINVKE